MDEETESEPLALMNLPAIVLGRIVRVSVIFGRQKSTKIWEEQGEYSPLEATINGLLVKVSLRCNEEDEDKSCESSAVALKSTKKWNFSKRTSKIGRYPRHSTYYKSSSTRHPAAPTTQSDRQPPPPPGNLATRCSKRKISKAEIAAQLTSSLKLSTLSESKLRQEIAEKNSLLLQQHRQQELRSKDKTKCAVMRSLLMESRKAGRKCTTDLKVSIEKVAKLEELSEERVEFFSKQLESTVLMKEMEQEVSVQCMVLFLTLLFCTTKQSFAQLADRSMRPPSWLLEELFSVAVM